MITMTFLYSCWERERHLLLEMIGVTPPCLLTRFEKYFVFNLGALKALEFGENLRQICISTHKSSAFHKYPNNYTTTMIVLKERYHEEIL